MQAAAGTSIWGGISIGRIHIYHRPEYTVTASVCTHPEAEWEKFGRARAAVKAQLQRLHDAAMASAGSQSAAIFEFYEEMLEDAGITSCVEERIRKERQTAEYAVQESFLAAADRFRDIEDPYFRARRDDVLDVGRSLVEEMRAEETAARSEEGSKGQQKTRRPLPPERDGMGPADEAMEAGTPIRDGGNAGGIILVAEDLLPSETVKFDRSKILGIVTQEGTPDSHTAILARSMNIPALIQCDGIHESWEGQEAILDGYDSCIYIRPSERVRARLTRRYEEDIARRQALEALRGQPAVTKDGREIHLLANISGPQDIGAVEQNDAEGVGLFRSEFVYLRSTEDPSEEMQFQAYRQVVKTLAPRPVIIRTCDIGADKSISYLNFGREVNPALGYRGIRISLSRPDFFRRQLRALLRASAYGKMGIMFPMITGTREVEECLRYLDTCREELRKEGREYDEKLPVGIMIETPAAVLCADELAAMVDFFSIGTNDLTQYTLAIDRQSPKVGTFLDPHHPAVLREIRMTAEAAHRHRIPVGICGELAADPALTETFLRMGIDELSVAPASILPLRGAIRSMDLAADGHSGHKETSTSETN